MSKYRMYEAIKCNYKNTYFALKQFKFRKLKFHTAYRILCRLVSGEKYPSAGYSINPQNNYETGKIFTT